MFVWSTSFKKWDNMLFLRFDSSCPLDFSVSTQGSFSEAVGFLVHCINLANMLIFPAAVVLLVPSMTPGKIQQHINNISEHI